METIVMIAQLLLGLSILVGLHEFGHLLAAKAFGMRVEQYSIGFPPKIFSFKYGETEYSISAIPLGGFVKISGMIDESLDTKSLSEEPQPWEFRAKPAWQRLIVMMGGIIMNVILGILIFVIMVYHNGETYFPKQEVNQYGIVASDIAQQIGLKTGDKIVAVNGHDYEAFGDLTSPDVLLGNNSYYTVERDGKEVRVDIPGNILDDLSEDGGRQNFITPASPFRVASVPKNGNAAKAGMQKGDQIVSVAGQPVQYYHQAVELTKDHAGDTVAVQVKRGEELKTLQVPITEDGKMGYYAEFTIQPATKSFNLMQSIPKGTHMAFNVIWVNAKALGKIFTGKMSASKSLSGPIGIAQVFGGTWDWGNFWRITGLLSMVLAFMNFLPIPALDGGHVMFLTYEIVSGRKPSDKFLENAQKVGMVILLSLMAFVIFNDIWKLFQ